MDLEHALAGLDGHPWQDSSHAYGGAEDLPALLRDLAGADEGASDEALEELYGSLLHQGTVYTASAEAVPFLVRIAAAGHRTADLLALLAGMAGSTDEHGVAPGALRSAVAGQLPLLLPLLGAPAAEVRGRAAWALSSTGATGPVLPALRTRWARETDPRTRAELLAAMSRLDARSAAAAAGPVLGPAHPAELRLAAVFAALHAGVDWTHEHHTTLLAVLPTAPLVAGSRGLTGRQSLADAVEVLLGRGDEAHREAAFALLDAALRDPRADVRAEAVRAAARACALSRSAARLVPALAAAAVDDAAVAAVAPLLGLLGAAAEPAAPVLAALAGRHPEEEDDLADRVLAALVRIDPGLAAPLLARALGHRPRALGAAAGLLSAPDPAFPYDPALLDAVRRRFARPESVDGREAWQLANLLAGWGPRAAGALPEVMTALRRHQRQTAPAVAALAARLPPAERARAAGALRTAAAQDEALSVAGALYELTGDAEVLLERIARQLAGDHHEVMRAAEAAGGLGPLASPLVPLLRAALSDPGAAPVLPALDADRALAEALWHIGGDAVTAVAALDRVLAHCAAEPWGCWSAIRAARAAAAIGPAARSLAPRLEALLGEPERVPAAARALAAVARPGTPARSTLAGAVLDSVGRGADPLEVCDALEALGGAALTPAQRDRLAVLAEGDARVAGPGMEQRGVQDDERLRARLRTLLAAPA
ncbi:hypothetical protein WDV06_11245 [Streptomyces racemochromogenes]|uniref:HEAT repeat domain-containing protein n=1 Tax=Streptomyces racemochromogenes TaxID=67353 RepID=A0ABW7PCC9_9ACTN